MPVVRETVEVVCESVKNDKKLEFWAKQNLFKNNCYMGITFKEKISLLVYCVLFDYWSRTEDVTGIQATTKYL